MRRTFPLIAAISLFLGIGCEDLASPFEERSEVAPHEIIELTDTRSGVLPADGVSLDTLRAMIPRGAKTRLVNFKTTVGSFTGAKDFQSLSVLAVFDSTLSDSRLVATAHLRADTTGVTTVSATIGDFSDHIDISLVDPSEEE